MDAYTQHLLGLAVGACGQRDRTISVYPFHVPADEFAAYVETYGPGPGRTGDWAAPTLDAALAALLTDLGVDVPERPSAERVADAEGWTVTALTRDTTHIRTATLAALRDLYAREPLTVHALLEGGAS